MTSVSHAVSSYASTVQTQRNLFLIGLVVVAVIIVVAIVKKNRKEEDK